MDIVDGKLKEREVGISDGGSYKEAKGGSSWPVVPQGSTHECGGTKGRNFNQNRARWTLTTAHDGDCHKTNSSRDLPAWQRSGFKLQNFNAQHRAIDQEPHEGRETRATLAPGLSGFVDIKVWRI